ncbi:hypothetical protein OIU85_002715 [Salix viminalis]|uniref:BRCT domain-containing protein n=1 Tax=Salix viminalis TaxID=40686 RepID=A0A9Q0VPF5_SALVM|nr:hypothetical protein OIU85_002715 [Salix viminalis]
MDDVEKFFKEAIENRDEGIVLKDLGSKWEPSDRSGKWLKLKPEVGNGLSDEELDTIVSKLKLYFRKNGYPKKSPPSFYQVTNNSKERPNVWIESPDKSIILSITSDIRTISSVVFSAPYSLRFPRIDRVRYDKLWHECLDVQSFIELVHSSNGTTQNGKGFGDVQTSKPTRVKSSWKGEKKRVSVVPSHLIQTDISDIKGETLIFSNVMFYFVNVPPTNLLESLHKMVAENGRTFSMNLNNSVTHCIAAESKGFKYQAAKLHGDIIHGSWIVVCKRSSFHYSQNINQLLSNINTSENAKAIDYFKKKRLKLEIFMGGGKVSNNIAHATHLVVLIVPASDVDFGSLVKSFTTAEKHFLLNKRFPFGLEESNSKEVLCDPDMEEATPILDGAGNEILPPDCVNKAREKGSKTAFKDSNKLVSLEKGMTRKRRRPAGGSTRKGEIGAGQARQTRARIVNKPAKISREKSDESCSHDDKNEENDMSEGNDETPAAQPATGTEETVQFMMVNPLLSGSYESWLQHRRSFLQHGIYHAYMQPTHGRPSSRASPTSSSTVRIESGSPSGSPAIGQKEAFDIIGVLADVLSVGIARCEDFVHTAINAGKS